MSKLLKYACFCCDKVLDGESLENPIDISTIYDGLFFRSTGNFGSRIFDPITTEEILQIVICDKCVDIKAKRVKHLFNIKTTHSADYCTFRPPS